MSNPLHMMTAVIVGGVTMNANDERVNPARYRYRFPSKRTIRTFLTPFWMIRSRYTGCDPTVISVVVGDDNPATGNWRSMPGVNYPMAKAGQKTRKIIQGIVLDQWNNIIPNVVIKCFRTSTQEFVQQVTSSPLGDYTITTPYTDSHYLIAYLTGSPDSMGATINTIVGT